MRFKYGICALALTAALSAPMMAKAALTSDQTAQIQAAVDTAMADGNTGKLQALLATMATASPNDAAAITDAATNQITKDMAANPSATLPGSTTTIAEAVTSATITSIIAAAPAQAGTVLAEAQTTLSADLQVAAVTATQAALAPAAGGNQQQLRNDIKLLVADFKQLLQVIIQTAEVARRKTASPS